MNPADLPELHNWEQLEHMVLKWGFLPFFRNEVAGFSVEEMTPRHLWFSDEGLDGPWEWKGPVICGGMCAYGKLYGGKAGYVSLEWLPDLANWRRASRSTSSDERHMLQVLQEHESLLSGELRKSCGYPRRGSGKGGRLGRMVEKEAFSQGRKPAVNQEKGNRREGFETAVTALQMGLRAVIADFEYLHDRHGRAYGWGIARYTTPEALYGDDFLQSLNGRTPQESHQRIREYLQQLLPHATEMQINKILG